MKIKIKLLHPCAKIPEYKTDGAAACDICAALDSPVTIEPHGFALIPAGFAIEPEAARDFALLIFARSGLATKHGIALANGVGVVDPDYRGEIKVSLINLSTEPYTVTPGERIAQMMLTPTARAEFALTDSLGDTERGDGGFGHTGNT